MEAVALTETESRYFGDLFLCCDIEKTGKIPMLKATELYRSANLSNDVIREITSLSGIPQTALHISRSQFYSCLKLIAAYQASMPLRTELISSSVNLPLPRFSWKLESTSPIASTMTRADALQTNGGMSMGMGGVAASGSSKGVAVPRRGSWFDTTSTQLVDPTNSDVPSTDSEVEHNESSSGREPHRHRGGGAAGGGSPEAWSTNSDSPTPTNSVAERPWAKESLWQGLLGDEHRQLLGTEEESSDRHSSDDDNEGDPFYYQITPEQREYYQKQFKAVQHDPNGLLSGHIARVFFEKSQIPVKELRHIWQLCDVTRDGALSLAEFTAAMHLVVLRRHNLPLPAVLPACLHPNMLVVQGNQSQTSTTTTTTAIAEPPEADLLHLNDDDEDDNTDTTIKQVVAPIAAATSTSIDPDLKRVPSRSEKNAMNMSTLSTSSQASTGSKQQPNAAVVGATQQVVASISPPPAAVRNRSISNSPSVAEPTTTPPPLAANLWKVSVYEWTKYMDSPVSDSPGPKPVNFDMKRTAQAVVSDPQILHPVPLRVTPVAGAEVIPVTADDEVALRLSRKAENLVYDTSSGVLRDNNDDASPKQQQLSSSTQPPPSSQVPSLPAAMTSSHHRDSLQNNDLRAIQRPQAKKLPAKNIGAIPPPPQREPSIGSNNAIGGEAADGAINSLSKKDPPPLPPPRPHRHGRSSSLDLNKFKLGGPSSQPEATNEQLSSDAEHSGSITLSTCSQPPAPRYNAISGGLQSTQRVSAFEVYRKPNTPRNSQSPDFSQHNITPLPPPSLAAVSNTSVVDSDSLRHVSFRHDNKNMPDVLRHLREQNSLLLRICSDLSDELLGVTRRKEEMRTKVETISQQSNVVSNVAAGSVATSSSSVSAVSMAPVTANITGGSGSSGVHSNV
ncbi:ralBP1-associated Eps domain-containing protein 2 isoform X2 [Eupeodes corollae]|uniref:ralBP1-associated Eps domain-containing protein 2 isoform X2 n=1 Tax=Eupeodes corollae TaxID=290404 RepID=UPI00248F74F9|nr:ralBP1-associated Eps domain-containing protein 2 isoform X2 [Eupeodes corollae]